MTNQAELLSPATPDIPVLYRVVGRTKEAPDVVTLRVRPTFGPLPAFRPAQFSMIGVLGVGEVPISISSTIDDVVGHDYTIRRAGAVTSALVDRDVGGLVTIRGPFGRAWDLHRADGRHAVFVAGGIGLAPLRAAIDAVVRGGNARRVSVLVGAATPADHIHRSWLRRLADEGVDVRRAVDRPEGAAEWREHVGRVTELIPQALSDAAHDVAAYVCGPDPMMTATLGVLAASGVDLADIELTLERNMQCGAGWCGHCQLGPFLLCRDGPVLGASDLGDLLERPEL